MKIGINGLAAKTGGGVTYLENLITNILEISDHRLYFFVSSIARERFDIPVDVDRLTVESVDISGMLHRLWYEQTVIPWRITRENIDLLYSPSEVPVLWCPCDQVMANQNSYLYYDVDIKKPLRQRIRERGLAGTLVVSQFISEATIFVSESSKRKAVTELDISGDDAFSIHHGVDSAFADTPTECTTDVPGEDEYILFVSTLYKHKNVHNLIAAYSRLPPEKRRQHPLVIVGGKTIEKEYTQTVKSLARELGVAEDVSLVGHVSETAVRSYYHNAHLFVFPSLIESFGLPVLEAMASGVPVVASSNAAIPEVGGDAALYFDPQDPDQMSVIIERALTDQELREELMNRGKERVSEFTWEKCTRNTLEVFEEVTGFNESSG